MRSTVDGVQTGGGLLITSKAVPVKELISKLAEEREVQPWALVTVKLYVPGLRPDIVFVDPLPKAVILPGLRVNVQFPFPGNPFNTTVPVNTSL